MVAPGRDDQDQGKGVAVDGGMVNLGGQDGRELKVGPVVEVELHVARNPHPQQLDAMAEGGKGSYPPFGGLTAN